jgi:uncharacterized protein (DUF2062 family)
MMMALHAQAIKDGLLARIWRTVDEFRSEYREMIRADAPVLTLAAAFAVGTLVSMVPIPVLDMALAAMVMRLVRGLPRGPIVVAMALWNSVVMAPVYATSPRVGGLLIATMASHSSLQIPDAILLQVLVGTVALAAGMSLGSFLIATTLLSMLRRR